jgi:hypothetical protein
MEKKRSDVQDILKHSRNLLSGMAASSTRAAIVTAAALLDDLLYLILAARMLNNDKVVNKVLSDESLTFSRRIDLCYSLGLISHAEKHDLHIIRKIRNDVAHSWKPVSLKQEALASRFRSLYIPKEFWKDVGTEPRGTKLWFLSGWVILTNQLVLRLNQTQHLESARETFGDQPIVFGGGSAPKEERLTKRLSRRRHRRKSLIAAAPQHKS